MGPLISIFKKDSPAGKCFLHSPAGLLVLFLSGRDLWLLIFEIRLLLQIPGFQFQIAPAGTDEQRQPYEQKHSCKNNFYYPIAAPYLLLTAHSLSFIYQHILLRANCSNAILKKPGVVLYTQNISSRNFLQI